MTDLRFIIGTDASLRIEPIGDFADWTLESVQWMSVLHGGILSEGAAGDAFREGSVTQVVAQVVGPEGQTTTLTSPVLTVVAGGSSVRVEPYVEGESFEFTAPFAEGAALFVAYDSVSERSRDAAVSFADGRHVDYTLDENDRSLVRVMEEQNPTDVFERAARTRTFDDEGRLTREEIVFNDGTYSLSEYAEGRLTREVIEFADETSEIFIYSYDADQLIQIAHTNRLGLLDEMYFEAGVITERVRYDHFEIDAYNFTVDWRSYEDGVISMRNMQLDDGVQLEWHYQSGVLEYQTRMDVEDAHSYYNRVTFFDDGLLRSDGRIMDDGRGIVFWYNEGVRSRATFTDEDNAFTWSEKTNFYGTHSNATDYVTDYNTTFDDGRHQHRRFEQNTDGEVVIRRSVMTDLEDAYVWTSRDQIYNESGTQTQGFVTYDDGVVAQTIFADGFRSVQTVSDQDDARSFTSVLRVYDEGELQTATVNMDDGRLIERRYDYGELATVASEDRDDAFLWTERFETHYASELATRATLFDNGVMQNEQFDQGQRTYRERLDESDAHRWHSITEQFEDGVRVSRDVVWDDDLIV